MGQTLQPFRSNMHKYIKTHAHVVSRFCWKVGEVQWMPPLPPHTVKLRFICVH